MHPYAVPSCRPPRVACVLLTISACFLGHWPRRGSGAEPPNILFILSDDLGYGDLGAYPASSNHGKLDTPNIDALTRQSMMFTDAYAGSTVCAPSRCALMTGRHTGHCTVRQNGQVLDKSDITVATVLQKEGYSTGIFGKWGLSPSNNATSYNHPKAMGFDEFVGYISQENAHNYYPPFLWHNWDTFKLKDNAHASSINCGTPYTEKCTWAEDVFVSESIGFLKNASQNKQPFYLFISFTTPHAGGVGQNAETGIPVPAELPQYEGESWPKVEKYFASSVTIQDQHVGTILGALNDLGLANNTVVFFSSDNGAHNEGGHSYLFFDSSGPLRGFKRSLHEGGVRTPLLIRWPGVVQPATVSTQQWSFWDFLQTAADIAGINASSLPTNIDGYSLLPTLQGKAQDQPKYVYHEFCGPLDDPKGWGQAVRFRDWRAIRYDFSSSTELYSLENDLPELLDVAAFFPEVVVEAVGYMDDAHSPGPCCGCFGPNPN